MKRKLILIGGVPGSGKTTVSEQLNKTLEKSIWLDGDWCWMVDSSWLYSGSVWPEARVRWWRCLGYW